MLFKYFAIFAALWALVTREARAYLDPGTGSYFVQIVIASIAGGGYLLFTSWSRVKKFFGDLSSRVKNQKSDEDAK